MAIKGKIINDPVYGFLRFPEPELMRVMEHEWFQRLRNIKQMGPAHLVYPGAVHTRLHHSLGACHLMGKALDELNAKDITVSKEERLAARLAILLHDIGHGPFSHALEHTLVEGIAHEDISRLIMQKINEEWGGALSGTIEIFEQSHERKFLHQLVASQLDVDRMDYLNRDSFYTGVSEGVIGYDRILQMLTVRDGELMVEEKGVHSVEKFIIARRLMYWQVYLHKTVLGAEVLLINILKRAKELAHDGAELFATPALKFFLYKRIKAYDFYENPEVLQQFCLLDDNDILTSIKVWQEHSDIILSTLCRMLTSRRLYKVVLSSDSLDHMIEEKRKVAAKFLGLHEEHLKFFVATGTTSSSTYNINDEKIQIAMKNGFVKEISEIDNPIVNQALAAPIHKNYLCYIQPWEE
jgi:HD superfamily phosphohydrolase